MKVTDRIFKFENRDVQREFCACLNLRLGLKFNNHLIHKSEFVMINLRNKHTMGKEAMRWKAHRLITQDSVDAMQVILDEDALVQFVFK